MGKQNYADEDRLRGEFAWELEKLELVMRETWEMERIYTDVKDWLDEAIDDDEILDIEFGQVYVDQEDTELKLAETEKEYETLVVAVREFISAENLENFDAVEQVHNMGSQLLGMSTAQLEAEVASDLNANQEHEAEIHSEEQRYNHTSTLIAAPAPDSTIPMLSLPLTPDFK